MSSRRLFVRPFHGIALIILLALCQFAFAEESTRTVSAVNSYGNTIYVPDDRRPALYTGDFGDCMGNSSINLTRFDAAFYRDNMTVVFHFDGHTSTPNDTLMLYMGVFAYGQPRIELIFDPCKANIYSLCPTNNSIPIEAEGLIPLSQTDVAEIPSAAYSIPDFEGQAILRFFSNSTQSQIACYASVVTNGSTFAQSKIVGTILAVFLIACLASSLALSIYGDEVISNRTHFAHGPSAFVVFAVLHHIYYSGALSLNWPSVLVAFWSNYAWFAGMIYSERMQNSINSITSKNRGDIRMFGAEPAGEPSSYLGGGLDLSRVYKRDLETGSPSAPNGTGWHGSMMKPGLPLPGNYSGFAGTLAQDNIPSSNAFLTGLVWFLVILILVPVVISLVKLTIEVLLHFNKISARHLGNFRIHWKNYAACAMGRTTYIGFFVLTFLTLFEFALGGTSAIRAIAAILFITVFSALVVIIYWPFRYRVRRNRLEEKTPLWQPDRLFLQKRKSRVFPAYALVRASAAQNVDEPAHIIGSIPWFTLCFIDPDLNGKAVHSDIYFVAKFGWLSARFRSKSWSFFAVWPIYDFIHACLRAGAAAHPTTQVICLLVYEVIATAFMIWVKPFEATRINLMVYLLGFSKISVLALSATLLPQYNRERITATVIGIVIIIIQGGLTACLLAFINIGMTSTFMSLTRYEERPSEGRTFHNIRIKYLKHLEIASAGIRPPPPSPPPSVQIYKDPYFSVSSVRRYPKIGEEEKDSSKIDGPFCCTPNTGRRDLPNLGHHELGSTGGPDSVNKNEDGVEMNVMNVKGKSQSVLSGKGPSFLNGGGIGE